MLAIGLLLANAAGAADAIRVGGNGAGTMLLQRVVPEFVRAHPEAQMNVIGNLGSNGGLKALAAGALDVAVIAKPLGAEERSRGFVEIPLGRSPLVFASTKEHPGLTLKEVAAIFRGDVTTWPDGSLVRLVLRPKTDSETADLRAMSPEMDGAVSAAFGRPGTVLATTDPEAAEALEKVPGSLGTTSLGVIMMDSRGLRAIRLNGVEPSLKNLESGQYPYSRALYLVIPAKPARGVSELLQFLRSPPGRNLLASLGFLPAESSGR
ncbi:MAG TPA: substrate-binding domain-containing protein [Burkholderiales bacterium]|nr:substrate-binding domain-containing protein [Burkholderiales bacterium]